MESISMSSKQFILLDPGNYKKHCTNRKNYTVKDGS